MQPSSFEAMSPVSPGGMAVVLVLAGCKNSTKHNSEGTIIDKEIGWLGITGNYLLIFTKLLFYHNVNAFFIVYDSASPWEQYPNTFEKGDFSSPFM